MQQDRITIDWCCPECDHETEVLVVFPQEARVHGPPEKCYPAYGGEIGPDQCKHCGAPIDFETAMDLGIELFAGRRDDALEAKAEKAEEDWREDR